MTDMCIVYGSRPLSHIKYVWLIQKAGYGPTTPHYSPLTSSGRVGAGGMPGDGLPRSPAACCDVSAPDEYSAADEARRTQGHAQS